MGRRKSEARQKLRKEGPKLMSLKDWLSEPQHVARRGEVWGVIQLSHEIQKQNTRWAKFRRWVMGSPVIDMNPFRLWSRITGTPEATLERPPDAEVVGEERGEEMPPEEERRIVTIND